MNRAATAAELRRRLVADSIERKRWMDQLIEIVRRDTREKVIADLVAARNTDVERKP